LEATAVFGRLVVNGAFTFLRFRETASMITGAVDPVVTASGFD